MMLKFKILKKKKTPTHIILCQDFKKKPLYWVECFPWGAQLNWVSSLGPIKPIFKFQHKNCEAHWGALIEAVA